MGRIFGLTSFVAAAIWELRWEVVRAFLYDRGFHFMGLMEADTWIHYGPSVALGGLGIYLFWRTSDRKLPSINLRWPRIRARDQSEELIKKGAEEFASDIPDVRIADNSIAWKLFETADRDKLLPLLERGKIDAWGRLGHGHPPLTLIPADQWKTHYLINLPADGPGRINQTYFRPRARPYESTYYDVHFNRAQLSRAWPNIWDRVPLMEAARRAYEQTKDREVSIFPYALSKSDDDILTWYCNAMTISHEGKPPLIKLYGNQPPSRIIEPIEVQLFNRYDFEVDGGSIILKERNGRFRFENLSVDPAELEEAIKQMSKWGEKE